MENSYEALYTGVYIFIFVASLTIALYLFQGINDLADRAYEYGKAVDGSAVIEIDDEDGVSLSKEDVISYYFNYIKKDNYENASVEVGIPSLSINGISNNNFTYSQLKGQLNKSSYQLTMQSDGSFLIQ